MKKSKRYDHTYFSADVLKEGCQEFLRQVNPEEEYQADYYLTVEIDDAELQHDSIEEFFADYRRAQKSARFNVLLDRVYARYPFLVSVHGRGNSRYTIVEIGAPDRSKTEAIFNIFEKHAANSKLPVAPPAAPEEPTVFIGHGQNPLWKDVKDHLQDQHGYKVVAYEVGARAGHEIRDILEEMLNESTFAILVMTGEDETRSGKFQPRLNVVHELGLFQGRLGFRRTMILLEEGIEEFSNISGIHQVRFSKGNIKETYGDVLATLRREFPESSS